MKDTKEVKEMCEQHWSYVKGILIMHGEDLNVIDKIGWHYIQAMMHGYKHAVQDMDTDKMIYVE
jgi:hypothetical protein